MTHRTPTLTVELDHRAPHDPSWVRDVLFAVWLVALFVACMVPSS